MPKAPLHFSRLSHREVYRLTVSFLRDSKDTPIPENDLILKSILKRLEQETERFHQGLSAVKDTGLSRELAQADKQRDQALQTLQDLIYLHRHSQSADKQEAYQLLKPLVANITRIKKSHYELESAHLTGLLKQLKTPDMAQASALLQLTPAITELTKSQQAFDQLMLKRHLNKLKQPNYHNKETRQNLQDTYQRLGDYLQIAAEEVQTPIYQTLYRIYQTNTAFFRPLTYQRHRKNQTESSTVTDIPTSHQTDSQPQD